MTDSLDGMCSHDEEQHNAPCTLGTTAKTQQLHLTCVSTPSKKKRTTEHTANKKKENTCHQRLIQPSRRSHHQSYDQQPFKGIKSEIPCRQMRKIAHMRKKKSKCLPSMVLLKRTRLIGFTQAVLHVSCPNATTTHRFCIHCRLLARVAIFICVIQSCLAYLLKTTALQAMHGDKSMDIAPLQKKCIFPAGG